MSTYTSSATLVKDIVDVLVAAGFCNDDLPMASQPPNRPIFRVGVSTMIPMVEDMQNTDKSTVQIGVEIAYLYPVSGGNPQSSEYLIADGVEQILHALATTTKLDAGTALSFLRARIRNMRPSYNRADISLTSVISI